MSTWALRAALESRFDIPAGIRRRSVQETLAGFPRGRLTEISGAVSTGRTALLLSRVAQATAAGECCAWIDTAGAFDPESAGLAGIALERMLWVNCRGDAEKALKAADLVLQAGGFGIVVFDLAGVPESMVRRISMTSWFRLRNAAEQNHTALVAMGEKVLTGSCSAVKIAMHRVRVLWRGLLLHGIRLKALNSEFDLEFDAVR